MQIFFLRLIYKSFYEKKIFKNLKKINSFLILFNIFKYLIIIFHFIISEFFDNIL